ncbi:hypothetical protein NUW58_g4226 [Xylaria curta]|uniref:Uncharacterized protein n=1 Tax=Xylaria curta TaxID=42375 RepID=A0ACC1P7R9_9PEZI|nr:hypothetical protein NUW58_g4226 [Xylaria curta]
MSRDSSDEYRESSSEYEVTRLPIHNPPSVSPMRESPPIRRKRRIGGFIASVDAPPLKRVRGNFNAAYLNLLNRDIQDAAIGLVHDEDSSDFEYMQIGAVTWSTAERKVFFAAVSRLGKDDSAGISARIGTKSELEVRQYLALLNATGYQRTGEGKGAQRPLRPVDIPAAVEIGAECGAALEAAADALSLRQETYEEEVEKARWDSRWLITAPFARILENSFRSQQQKDSRTPTPQPHLRGRGQQKQQWYSEDDLEVRLQLEEEEQEERTRSLDELSFLQLFSVQNWLQLSDRIFMNSAVVECNWQAVSENPDTPAIQTTALADFHALACSVTRRLLLAAIYMAESRLRTKSLDDKRKRGSPRIRVEDVLAAVSSLGMKQNCREFWARCARRLQLDIIDDKIGETGLSDTEDGEVGVYGREVMDGDDRPSSIMDFEPDNIEETEQETDENTGDDYEIMSYDEVETALGYPVVSNTYGRSSTNKYRSSAASEYMSSNSEEEPDEGELEGEYEVENAGSEDDEYEEDIKMEEGGQKPFHHESYDGLNPDAITADIEEAIISLASVERAGASAASVQEAIKYRVRAEHKLEQDAERLDLQVSTNAEAVLWAVLRDDSDLITNDHRR